MRTRRLFLMTLVVLTALAALDGYLGSPSARWGWDGIVEVGPRRLLAADAEASVSDRLEAPLGDGEVLSITNPRGSIRVVGEDRSDVAVEYTITVFAETEEQAAAYAQQLRVEADRRRDGLALDLVRPGRESPEIADFAVEYRIMIPRGARVALSNNFGPVEVTGVSGPSRVRNHYDKTTVWRVEGDWSVEARFGTAQVEGVNGAVQIDGAYGSGRLSQVRGPVTGAFEFGALDIDEAGSLDVRSSYGGIQARRVTGPARLELSFSGASIEGVAHDLMVTGRYGDVIVELDPAAPGFRIETESRGGRIRSVADRLQGHTVTRSGGSERLEAVVGDGSRIIDISVQSGTVTLR